jgi:hypothetical protein
MPDVNPMEPVWDFGYPRSDRSDILLVSIDPI